jgi:hypothetical protein
MQANEITHYSSDTIIVKKQWQQVHRIDVLRAVF